MTTCVSAAILNSSSSASFVARLNAPSRLIRMCTVGPAIPAPNRWMCSRPNSPDCRITASGEYSPVWSSSRSSTSLPSSMLSSGSARITSVLPGRYRKNGQVSVSDAPLGAALISIRLSTSTDRCVPKSNVRMLSIASPKNSIRIGESNPGEKMSRIPRASRSAPPPPPGPPARTPGLPATPPAVPGRPSAPRVAPASPPPAPWASAPPASSPGSALPRSAPACRWPAGARTPAPAPPRSRSPTPPRRASPRTPSGPTPPGPGRSAGRPPPGPPLPGVPQCKGWVV